MKVSRSSITRPYMYRDEFWYRQLKGPVHYETQEGSSLILIGRFARKDVYECFYVDSRRLGWEHNRFPKNPIVITEVSHFHYISKSRLMYPGVMFI